MFELLQSLFKRTKNVTESVANPPVQKEVLDYMQSAWFSYVGTDFRKLGENIKVDLNTMYKISKTSKMAGAYIEKISNMVGRYGFEIYNQDGEKADTTKDKSAKEVLEKCKNVFRAGYSDNKTFGIFSMIYFTQVFSSGEVTVTMNKLNDLFLWPEDGRLKILDTRAIKKNLGEYGDIVSYEYRTKKTVEKFVPWQLVNFVSYPDIDNPV